MSPTEVVVGGTLKPDGTLELDQKPTLTPGRVRVILRQDPQPVAGNWWQFMQDARKKMEDAGCYFMTETEIQDHVEWLREEDRVDDLLRETENPAPDPGAGVMLVYCDSVIVMYFFDHTGPFNVRGTKRLAAIAAAGDQIAISDLVRLEYRVKPLKTADAPKLSLFDAFCSLPDVRVVPIARPVFELATIIRATHNFKLGDSLHLAAAVGAGCDRFLTNDARLAAFTTLPVDVLP